MAAIKTIAAAIDAQMKLDSPDVTPTSPSEFGATRLSVERKCPVIIYVPHAERITGPEGQGGDGDGNPRPLKTRNLSMAVHLWDCDVPHVEDLLDAFVRAVHAIGWGSYLTPHGTWETGAEIVTGWGVVYTLMLELKIPITRAPDTTAVVTAMPITPEIVTVIP